VAETGPRIREINEDGEDCQIATLPIVFGRDHSTRDDTARLEGVLVQSSFSQASHNDAVAAGQPQNFGSGSG
jgi:hypothetical protein